MLLKSRLSLCQLRWFSSSPKIKLIETFNSLLEGNEVKHRKHPGIIKKNIHCLPEPIVNVVKIVLEDFPSRAEIYAETKKFRNHLHGRHVALEESEINEIYENVQEKLLKKANNSSKVELETLCKKNRPKALNSLKKRVNLWKGVNYDEKHSLLYLTARAPQDFLVLYTIFNEIRVRDEKFIPQAVIDFGSGIGTTMWAMNEVWPNKVKEFVNVDISNDMNSLSEKIMKKLHPKFPGIFYRQFMPMSLAANHDIAVSAYTLMELPNVKTRLDTLMKLWKKTKNYLVIVEQGTNAGFKIVTEARDFILHLSNSKKEKNEWEETHVFAPCPHDLPCPRLIKDDYPCNFEVGYTSLPMLGTCSITMERYSYVVLKKGPKSETDSDWPRLIGPTLKRGGHAHCRMCASSGNLEEIIFTRSKHGRHLYRCARISKWGDRIPLEKIESDASNEAESTSEKSENESDEENDDETKK